jgi:hypothetical protein
MNLRLLLLPACALAAYWIFARQSATPQPVLACTWRHGPADQPVQGRNFVKLPAETPLRLSVHTELPVHVYVYSLSAQDGCLLLYPAPGLASNLGNPLPAGQSVLPGQHDGKSLAWTSRSGIRGTTTVLAIASHEPIAELEPLAGQLRQWSNRVFPDASMLVTMPATKPASAPDSATGKPATQPAVLGMPNSGSSTGSEWPHELLAQAARQLREQTDPNGPMQPLHGNPKLFVSSWKFLPQE